LPKRNGKTAHRDLGQVSGRELNPLIQVQEKIMPSGRAEKKAS